MRKTHPSLPLFCLGLALAASVGHPGAALADPLTDVPPKPRPGRVRNTLTGEARNAFDRANELFRDGDFVGARVEYERAHKLGREPRILYNVAVCDKGLRRYARAIEQLDASLAEGGALLPPEYVALVEQTRGVLEPFVSTLAITSAEEGAVVLLDDEVVGTTPLAVPLRVEVGEHAVLLRKAGFLDLPVKVAVTSGVPAAVNVVLKPAASPAPRRHEGRLRITTDSASDVILLDGKRVGMGEYTGTVPSGEHRIRVTRAGVDPSTVEPYVADVLIRDEETRTLSVALSVKRGVPVWLWVAGAVAVAAGGTAGVLVATAKTKYNGSVPGTYNPKYITAGFQASGVFSW